VLAGTFGLVVILRYVVHFIFVRTRKESSSTIRTTQPGMQSVIVATLLIVALALPHLIGLVTVSDAEGYTSEIFPGENSTLQVAYPGYRDAVQWLASYTNKSAKVGLVVAVSPTLDKVFGGQGVSWYDFNKDLPARFQLSEAHPGEKSYSYDYLVWPMHLVQRGYAIPSQWHAHIIHIIKGGNTIYCFILAAPSMMVDEPEHSHGRLIYNNRLNGVTIPRRFSSPYDDNDRNSSRTTLV
jgi:hypothetical protein